MSQRGEWENADQGDRAAWKYDFEYVKEAKADGFDTLTGKENLILIKNKKRNEPKVEHGLTKRKCGKTLKNLSKRKRLKLSQQE